MELFEQIRREYDPPRLEETAFIGLAVYGTGAGRTTGEPCALCHPIKDAKGKTVSQLHHFVMISVVGAGLTLPFDIEPYGPGDSEYAGGKRLLKRAAAHLGPRFADYVVADGKFATAPFLHLADEVEIPVLARVKDNLPDGHGGRSPLRWPTADGQFRTWPRPH